MKKLPVLIANYSFGDYSSVLHRAALYFQYSFFSVLQKAKSSRKNYFVFDIKCQFSIFISDWMKQTNADWDHLRKSKESSVLFYFFAKRAWSNSSGSCRFECSKRLSSGFDMSVEFSGFSEMRGRLLGGPEPSWLNGPPVVDIPKFSLLQPNPII